MTQPIIDVDHVTKEFVLGEPPSLRKTAANLLRRVAGRPVDAPAPFKALDDISFQVAPGEVLGIIGHNGAGKSTLLKILARISEPTKGAVRVRGRVAPLIEVGAGLMPDMTGRENVYLNASILGMKKDEIRRRFDEIVDFAEIAEFVDTPVKRYSSGMKVKLGFSIATSVASEVLIVDEVLAVGDLAFQQKCIERMEKLMRGEGRTVLIVGHNIRQIQRICSRVMLMDHGHISMDGLPNEVCSVFYAEAQRRNLSRRPAADGEITATRSSNDITVRDALFLNADNEPIDAIGMHQPLQIRVEFETHRTLTDLDVVVGLQTSDFVHVIAITSTEASASHTFDARRHVITCQIPDVPLRPGSYSLRVMFANKYRQQLWSAENIKGLSVTAGDFDINKIPRSGLIDVPARWSIESRERETPMTLHVDAASGDTAELAPTR